MQIGPGHLGFDIDGVVADTMEAFIRLAEEDYAIKVSPGEITNFMVEECLDIDPTIIDDIFSRLMIDPIGSDLLPMKNALTVLEEFAQEAPLTFITARPEAGPISEWLELHLSASAFADSRLVATGDHDDKADHIRAMGLSHFIDDRAMTCNLLAGKTGITPIVYNQPWNFGRHTLLAVDNWQGIKKLYQSN
jgi:uncharacterized HAD superfamily protein